ncbi:MAG: caspase family protein [Bacteroides sp.]|nr:caspase family protein [Bacteroides sp.]
MNLLPVIAQPAIEKITLTGSITETVTINVQGEKYVTNRLPYEISLRQEQIPLTITIESANYEYRSIFIPKYTKKDYKIAKQSGDLINRTYVVGGEKKQQPIYYMPPTVVAAPPQAEPEPQIPISEVDNAPVGVAVSNAKTFVIIIANEKYAREVEVPYSLNDGKIFASYCQKTLGLPEQNIRLIENATLNDLKYNLSWLKQVMEAYNGEAKVLFYYAGHGIPDEAEKTAYLLPVDGYASDATTGYCLQTLYQELGQMPAKSVSVFLDACFSGAKREGDMLASARGVAIKVKESAPKGNMVVFSAAQGDETAYPYKEQQHGMFTYYLLKKLQETKGEATLGEICEYVTDQVRKQSIVVNGKMQTPTLVPSASVGEAWKGWKLK